MRSSIRSLILWPSVITLGITLLRLTGELLHWSPALFSPQAGGGGSLVGISWLPPVFGIVFAIGLVRAGDAPPSAGRAIGFAVLGVLATLAVVFGASAAGLMKPGQFSVSGLVALTLGLCAGSTIAWAGWPALGRTLLAYALAARVPVALLMLVAMIGDWQTHYDVAPPGFPQMGVFTKWLLIGAFPQLTTWLAITVLLGALSGSVAGAIASRGRAAASPDRAAA